MHWFNRVAALSLIAFSRTQPAVTQGNVGELAIDVLIASLQATKVATLEHEDILPIVGNDPHDMTSPGALSTSLELFEVPHKGTCMMG